MNPRERVELGRTGLMVTRLGLGTAPLAGLYRAVREEDALPWPEPSGQNEDDWVDMERAIEAALRGKPRVH